MKHPKTFVKLLIFRISIFLTLLISCQVFSQNTQNYFIELDSTINALHYKDGEKVTVYTQFKVNKTGEVIDIKARGPHRIFEKKAIDLVKDLPKYNPNLLKEKPVGTIFNLPFIFIIEEKK